MNNVDKIISLIEAGVPDNLNQVMSLAEALFEEDSKEMKSILVVLNKVLSDREEMILQKMLRDSSSSYIGGISYRSRGQGKSFVESGDDVFTIRYPARLSVELSYRDGFFFQVSLDLLESGYFMPTVWEGRPSIENWDVSRMPLLHKTLKTATKRLFPFVIKEEMNPQNFLDNALKMKTDILMAAAKPLNVLAKQVHREYSLPEPIVILYR